MPMIHVIYDPHELPMTLNAPPSVKHARMPVNDSLTSEEIAEVARELAKMLLAQMTSESVRSNLTYVYETLGRKSAPEATMTKPEGT